MDDMISRQAALDAIMGQPPEPHYPSWYAAQIKKLPATQPDHAADISKKVDGDDCISRRAAIELCDWYDNPSLHDDLEKLPSAQPEIIRCKDCKYRYLDGMIWNCPFGLSGGEDFFCAYGAVSRR